MNKQIVIDHANVSAWVIEKSGALSLTPSCVNSIGIVDSENNPLGGVIFHNYTGIGGSVTIHMAGTEDNWATRDFLWAIFDYAFDQLHVRTLIGLVPSDNVRALKVDLRLGFLPHAVIRDAYPDADILVLTMTRDRCKWLKHRPKTIRAGFGTLLPVFTQED